MTVTLLPPPDSPMSPNPDPLTPNQRDIRLRALSSISSHRRTNSSASNQQTSNDDDQQLLHDANTISRRDPPAYSPLDAYRYAEGVHLDLPADVIAAALEGGTIPASAVGQNNSPRSSDRRRTRRR